ncbi:DHA2 family efflux MFS transporter permease subunit [Acetobacterium sp.]|uniref:DHA2 family efflux MFS transporter permease subunit n=1 Tax=Acetobacterium sp. TaxID=1872094 RepID=UPI002F3F0ECD
MIEKTKDKAFAVMLAIILAGMVITMLNQSIINIALPQIMTQFNIDASTAQWLATAYMLVCGILVPISAYLVQKFSYKQLFITAMAFFTIGSYICAISNGFEVMLTGRVIQSVGGGILMPLSMNIFISAFPVEKRGSAMGLLGIGLILAPALGPTVSGYVIEYYNWNVLFYAMTAIGFCVLMVAFFFFNFRNEKRDVKLDYFGVITSSIGFGSLLYGINEIAGKGWNDSEVLTFLAVSVISLTVFVFYELKKQNPLLEMKVFKDFNFSYTIIVNIILQVALYGGMILLPLYLQVIRGFSPLEAGLLLLPGSLLMGIMGIWTGKLYDRMGIKPLAIIGFTILTVITYMFTKLSMDTPYMEIMILYTIRLFGLSFVLMPVTSAGLATIPRELIPHANALSSTLRQVAASIGIASLVVVMTNQARYYIQDLGTAVTADAAKLAAIHGINSAFLVSAIISAIALVLSFFFKKPKLEESKLEKEVLVFE